MLMSAPVAGRPLLSISTQEINLDDIGPDETLPAEIVDVVKEGAGQLDWTVTTEADWIDLEPQAGFFRLAIRPRPGNNRATVLVRDRGRGGSRTLRVSVWVRARTEPGPFVTIEPESVDFGHVEPSDREPASVGQARTRRRWVSVVAMLLVATIGVLGAWVSRPRSREASPRSTEASPRSEASVSSLRMLVADFRPLGVAPQEQLETVKPSIGRRCPRAARSTTRRNAGYGMPVYGVL